MTTQIECEALADSGHRFDSTRRWTASLALDFTRAGETTRLVGTRHNGPLRVQRPFYPEGPNGTCHVYLLHPPGGLVSGDALTIDVQVGRDADVLLTTPAASKLYKADSHGVAWQQQTRLRVGAGAMLEYLPQETIAFDGSRGCQCTTIELESGARTLGWEVLVLGRTAGNLPFVSGEVEQRFRLVQDGLPLWIERQLIDPAHARFWGAWGQSGASVQATLWAVGLENDKETVAAVRSALPASDEWAVTCRRGVVLLRYLGNERNRAWALCQQAWKLLRPLMIDKEASVPRIWYT